MNIKIETLHEEKYSDNCERIIGILRAYAINDKTYKESYLYTYDNGMYIFFNTIFDIVNYLLYGEKNMKRAYMKEDEFDSYYDAEFINEAFYEKLKWTS